MFIFGLGLETLSYALSNSQSGVPLHVLHWRIQGGGGQPGIPEVTPKVSISKYISFNIASNW